MLGIGLVGFGYWGPNLARNFASQNDCRLVAICEIKEDRAELAARTYPSAMVTPNYNDLLESEAIDAIVIATPVDSHFQLAKDALVSNKDVLVEKPIARTLAEARELVELAEMNRRILAVDHTFLFTGAIRKIKEIVDSGDLGEILYVDSVRINLGLFQQDVNVIYDLAPHDLSIITYLIDEDPVYVRAMGACHAHASLENIAYIHLEYANGMIAHFHLNWLAPVKIRRFLIGGTNKMVVYDDLESSEKVKVYDKGIVVTQNDLDTIYKIKVDYRTGDMIAPKLIQREALSVEVEHFLTCLRDRRQPISDGRAGVRVLQILEATQLSLRKNGERIKLEDF
jgi:predicted dehydrogenase